MWKNPVGKISRNTKGGSNQEGWRRGILVIFDNEGSLV